MRLPRRRRCPTSQRDPGGSQLPDDIDRVEVENVGERHELDDLDPALTALQHHIASLGCPDGAELLFLAVVTGVAALAAACSLDAPMFSLRKEDWTPEPTSWQKWIFVIWTLAGPLYLLWGWHSYQSNPHPPDFAKFQYGQNLLAEMWSA